MSWKRSLQMTTKNRVIITLEINEEDTNKIDVSTVFEPDGYRVDNDLHGYAITLLTVIKGLGGND